MVRSSTAVTADDPRQHTAFFPKMSFPTCCWLRALRSITFTARVRPSSVERMLAQDAHPSMMAFSGVRSS
jgi:hypothetical protein